MTQSSIFHLAQQALGAMERAVQKALKEHKRLGNPIYVMKDDRIQRIPASKISFRPYRKSAKK